MRTWVTFLFGRNLQIRCLKFCNICRYRSKTDCGTSIQEFHKQDSFNVPEDAGHDFTHRSLLLKSVLPCPSYSPNLGNPDFHQTLKDALWERPFADDDKLRRSKHGELWHFSKEFYVNSTRHLTQRWKKHANNEICGKIIPTLWRTYPWYMSKITVIVTTFSEEKIGGLFSYCPS